MKSMGREEEREGKNKGQKGEKEGWEEDDGRRWGGKKMELWGEKKSEKTRDVGKCRMLTVGISW